MTQSRPDRRRVGLLHQPETERQALDLFEKRDPHDALRLAFDDLTSRFTRNEQAALAFRLIEQLNRG